MSAAIRRHADVDDDVSEIVAHLVGRSPAVAERFIVAVQAAFDDLPARAGQGSPKPHPDPRLATLRTFRVEGFPNHLIYYMDTADGVVVLAVQHGVKEYERRLSRRTDHVRDR